MTNHANCSHPATKADRAKCRKLREASELNRSFARHADAAVKVAPLPVDPFDLLPEVEDDWADPDQWYGTGDDSGPGDADLLD